MREVLFTIEEARALTATTAEEIRQRMIESAKSDAIIGKVLPFIKHAASNGRYDTIYYIEDDDLDFAHLLEHHLKNLGYSVYYDNHKIVHISWQ